MAKFDKNELSLLPKIECIMEFEGVVYRKMPEVTGSSARGAWKKQDVVFELPSEFSRKICVTFFGDRADDAASLNEGDNVTVSVNVESREYNGKWYTDVKAWKIIRNNGGGNSRASGAFPGASGGYGGSGAVAGSGSGSSGAKVSPFSDAPFNENSAPTSSFNEGSTIGSPTDDVDDLPF